MVSTTDKTRLLSQITVILVETLQGGNLGATARAMKNMGLSRLRLVRPKERINRECQKMARDALHLVEEASIFDSLEDATVDQHLTLGTTSLRGRTARREHLTPRQAVPIILETAAEHRVALVFGPERSGLDQNQLALCQRLISIPSSPQYPTLNLAQAVLIVAYELYNGILPEGPSSITLATQSDREEMYRQMQDLLIEIGFLQVSNPNHIMRSIRRFLGTADLTPRDVQILRGIFRQMEWFADQGRSLPAEKVRKR